MADFFSSIVNGVMVGVEYIVSIMKSMYMYVQLLRESSVTLGLVIGFLPEIVQVSGMAVISIAIFKAIFGRQGSS